MVGHCQSNLLTDASCSTSRRRARCSHPAAVWIQENGAPVVAPAVCLSCWWLVLHIRYDRPGHPIGIDFLDLRNGATRRVLTVNMAQRFSAFFRDCPQISVNPRKLNVSGFPSPHCFRFAATKRPNSIRRVLSGCSSSPNFCRRSRQSWENCSASPRCWNPSTRSSY